MFKWLKFWSRESEAEKWTKLNESLNKVMFGQHIAVGEVFLCLKGHFTKEDPNKALVIICNGSLGTGKTYFANMIEEHIYDKQQNGKSVQLFVGPRDFPDSKLVSAYKKDLQSKIEAAAKKNPRTFFIFDEVDKMPIGLLDALTPYVDRHPKIGGVDFRKCVFMFLSNTGGQRIDKIVFQQSANKKEREHLTLFDFRKELESIVYNETGGLQGSAIISKRLIDQYVPFLPLEKRHIIQCLEAEYIQIHETFLRPVNLHDVAEMFDYYPEDNPIFAEEGAKNVNVKILHAREYVNKNLPLPKRPKRKHAPERTSLIENGIAPLD